MKKFFREYFSFSQVEIKGIRVLLIILLACTGFYFLMPLLFKRSGHFDFTAYQQSVDTFMAHSVIDSSFYDKEYPSYKSNYYSKQNWKDNQGNFVMKPFDPNGLPLEIWVAMGLSEKQAQVIKNYETKGGKFRTKEDVRKQYVISPEFYQKIEPYLVFAEINDEITTEHAPLSVDINHAPKEDWVLLNGIGDKLADKIISYREKLGGFHSVDQLKEVYGLPETTFVKIREHCFVTSYSLRKINVNLATYDELHAHPYINGELPKLIINYRKKHGNFDSEEEFKKSGLVDDVLYAKLVPYLSFSH